MSWGHTLRQLDHKAIPAFAAAFWGADQDSVRLVSDGFNVVFRFVTDGQAHYLRVNHPDCLTYPGKFPAAVDFLRHVSKSGASVCRPVPSLTGHWIETLPSGYMATVVQEVPGSEIPLSETDPAVFHAWGRSLGSLHNASESYVPAAGMRFLTADELWQETSECLFPHDQAGREEFRQIDAWLKAMPERTSADYGMTHSDFRPGNMRWDGETVWIIDFDEPVYHWYVSDLARALLEYSDRPIEERRMISDQIVSGYRAVRPLDGFWLDNLSWFVRLKNLAMYAWDCAYEPILPNAAAGSVNDLTPYCRRMASSTDWSWL